MCGSFEIEKQYLLFGITFEYLNNMHGVTIEIGKRYINRTGTAVAQWLRRCAANRKVAGSNFSLIKNPSNRTMALGSTQPLTEMSTRSISWGVKAAGA